MNCTECGTGIGHNNKTGVCSGCQVKRNHKYRTQTQRKIFEKALLLEKRLIELGIESGETFQVVEDVVPFYPYQRLGKMVMLVWGDLVESYNWYYELDEEGLEEPNEVEVIVMVPEFRGFLIRQKIVRHGDYRSVLEPAPFAVIERFIQEAEALLRTEG